MARNVDYALGVLAEYHKLLTEYLNRMDDPDFERGPLHAVLLRDQGPVREVVRDVTGEEPPRFGELPRTSAYRLQRLITEAIGTLAQQEEFEENWSADTPIRFSEEWLHSDILDGIRVLWSVGHYGEAVEAAYKIVNARLQDKVGRTDIGGTDLVNQSFGKEPPRPGAPKIHLGDPEERDTFANLNDGARALGQAGFMFFRNPISHSIEDVPIEEAIEGLAVANALLRVIDRGEMAES